MKQIFGIAAAILLTTPGAFGQASGEPRTGGTPDPKPANAYNVISNSSVGNSAYASVYNQGLADFKAGRLSQAALAMQTVESKDPNNVTAHSILGYIYLKQKKSELAVTEMESVVRLAPKDPGARKNLGRAYLQTAQPAKAAEQFQAVLVSSPMDRDAEFGVAIALGQENKYDDAAAAFEKVVASSPTSNAYQNLGVVLQKSGKTTQAADAFQKAASLDGKNGVAWLNAGLLYAQSGANDKAIADLGRAIALDTDYKYEAHLTLAQAYHNSGNDAKAIAEFDTASKIRPKEATPLFNLAVLQQQAGQTADAEQTYQRIIELKPANAQIMTDAQTNLGLLLADDGKADQALPLLQAVIQADPRAAAPHAAMGNLYTKQGNAAKAMEERQIAVDLDPSDKQTRLLLADALLAQKRYRESAEQYGAVAKLDPKNASVQNALGTADEQSGNLSGAQAAFRAALAGNGSQRDKAEAENNLGVIFEKQGKKAAAIAAYKKAVSFDPTLAEAKRNLARYSQK